MIRDRCRLHKSFCAWRLFYSDINERPAATESTLLDRRKIPQTKSSVNIVFSGLRICDLAVILVDQARKGVLNRFDHIVMIDQNETAAHGSGPPSASEEFPQALGWTIALPPHH